MTTTQTTRRGRLRASLVLAGLLAGLGLAGPAAAATGTGTADARAAAGVTISGEPLVHTFTGTAPEQVEATWTVRSTGGQKLVVDGGLRGTGGSDLLAEHLTVEYGRVAPGGEVETWYPAGTLAAPRGWADAVGGQQHVDGAEDLVVAVRVGLPDPGALLGLGPVTATADFVVVALPAEDDPPVGPGPDGPSPQDPTPGTGDDPSGGTGSVSAGDAGADLAVTGIGIASLLALATGLLVVGAALRVRSGRRATETVR